MSGSAISAFRHHMIEYGTMKDGITKLATAEGDETFPGATVTSPYFTALRDALDHWGRGAAPPISVHDCARAVQLIDQAYKRAS
jgi:hypothetical protein